MLWEYTPRELRKPEGDLSNHECDPVADDDRKSIYSAAPDGTIRKLAVADGRLIWATPITRLAEREKIASPLSFFHGKVIAATDGYIGRDGPPDQGPRGDHGRRDRALSSTCGTLCPSDRHELLDPSSVPQSDSGIWGRAGVVIDPATGNLYIATGNGTWDGAVNWGDAVIELDQDATRILGNYTPINTEELNDQDADLGSTSPRPAG